MLNLKRWREKHWLVAIFVIAVLLRAAAALYMGDRIEILPGIHDQISYDALAKSLVAGKGFQFPENWYPFTPAETPTAHWSFLYPPFLAGVYQLFGYHPLSARLIQGVIAGVMTSLLVFLIGSRLADRRAALIGAALTAVYGYFVYYNAALMTETFFIIFVLASLYVALLLRERPTLLRWVLLGLCLGLATLLRQTMLLVIPVMLVWLWWELRGRARLWQLAVAPIVITLLILPWTLRNQHVYGQFLPLNSNAGYALYASLHPQLGTDWRNDNVVLPVPDELQGLNEAALNSALTRKAVGFVLEDPGRIFLLTVDKATEYFRFWPSSDSSLVSNITRTLSFGLYLPLMILGLLLSLPQWRKYLPLYLLLGIHTAAHLISWPAPRYRLTADALLMPLVGLAVFVLWRWVSERRSLRNLFPGKNAESKTKLLIEPAEESQRAKTI